MPPVLPTIIDAYLTAALKGVQWRRRPDGMIELRPAAFSHLSVVAPSVADAVGPLVRQIEDVVLFRTSHGYELPPLDGVDLAPPEGQRLVDYHPQDRIRPVVVPLQLTPEAGGYIVESPLLPELITEGDDLDEAIRNARDALVAVLEIYADGGRKLPDDLAGVRADSALFDVVEPPATAA